MVESLLSLLSDNHPLREEDNYHWASLTSESLLEEIKMVLLSRVRISEYEVIPFINKSILNYGVDESFSKAIDINTRLHLLEGRIINAISRFEPRLTNVTVGSVIDNKQILRFSIRAIYLQHIFLMELCWDDCTARLYINE